MTRAEFFVLHRRGHWAKCRVEFLCDCDGAFGPCLNPVKPGEMYLATDLPKYPDQPGNRNPWRRIKKRYCAHCADQQITVPVSVD